MRYRIIKGGPEMSCTHEWTEARLEKWLGKEVEKHRTQMCGCVECHTDDGGVEYFSSVNLASPFAGLNRRKRAL